MPNLIVFQKKFLMKSQISRWQPRNIQRKKDLDPNLGRPQLWDSQKRNSQTFLYYLRAKNLYSQFEHIAREVTVKSEGILSGQTVENIKWMFFNQAWYTANDRAGYRWEFSRNNQNLKWTFYRDKWGDKRRAETHLQNLKNIGEVTTGLADNLRRLGIMAAWYWQNKIKNYSGKVSFLTSFGIIA